MELITYSNKISGINFKGKPTCAGLHVKDHSEPITRRFRVIVEETRRKNEDNSNT
jgi:hypothetical protein